MYIFGKFIDANIDKKILGDLFKDCDQKLDQLTDISIISIIDILDQVGKSWNEDGKWYKQAFEIIQREASFDLTMIKETLDVIPDLLSREVLLQRVKADFGNTECLDEFVSKEHFDGKYFCSPLGKVLHVCAGNVYRTMWKKDGKFPIELRGVVK